MEQEIETPVKKNNIIIMVTIFFVLLFAFFILYYFFVYSCESEEEGNYFDFLELKCNNLDSEQKLNNPVITSGPRPTFNIIEISSSIPQPTFNSQPTSNPQPTINSQPNTNPPPTNPPPTNPPPTNPPPVTSNDAFKKIADNMKKSQDKINQSISNIIKKNNDSMKKFWSSFSRRK